MLASVLAGEDFSLFLPPLAQRLFDSMIAGSELIHEVQPAIRKYLHLRACRAVFPFHFHTDECNQLCPFRRHLTCVIFTGSLAAILQILFCSDV